MSVRDEYRCPDYYDAYHSADRLKARSEGYADGIKSAEATFRRTHPAGHRQTEATEHRLILDDYQAANLLHLLEQIMVYPPDTRPVHFFNTGDWVGELRWLLDGSTSVPPNPVRNS